MPGPEKMLLRVFPFLCCTGLAFMAGPLPGDESRNPTAPQRNSNVKVPAGWEVKPPAPGDGNGLRGEYICTFREKGSANSPELTLQAITLPEEPRLEDYAAEFRKETAQLQQKDRQLHILERAKVVIVNGKQVVKCVVAGDGQAMVSYHSLQGKKAFVLSGVIPQAQLERYRKAFERIITGLDEEKEEEPAKEAPAAADSAGPGSEVEDLIRKGTRLFAENQLDQAIERFNEALEKKPEARLKAHLLSLLSACNIQKGLAVHAEGKGEALFQKSLEYSKEALGASPDYWLAHASMATAYMHLGQLEKADQSFKEAEKNITPSHPAYQKLLFEHGVVTGMLKAKAQADSKSP